MKKSLKSKVALCAVALSCVCAVQGAFANPVHDAAKSGDAASVVELSNKNPGWVNERCFGYVDVVPTEGAVKGYQLNVVGNGALTPLEVAAYRNEIGIVQLLLSKFAGRSNEADVKDHLLNIVAVCGYRGMVKFLIENGADVNIQNEYGSTPLHCAVSGANAAGDVINSQGGYASPEEYWRPYNMCKEVIMYLINNHADTGIRDRSGKTAADNADFTMTGFNFWDSVCKGAKEYFVGK